MIQTVVMSTKQYIKNVGKNIRNLLSYHRECPTKEISIVFELLYITVTTMKSAKLKIEEFF